MQFSCLLWSRSRWAVYTGDDIGVVTVVVVPPSCSVVAVVVVPPSFSVVAVVVVPLLVSVVAVAVVIRFLGLPLRFSAN